MQQARARQQSEAFAEYRQRRVVVEHRLARLVQLGIRQARYFGRVKTKFQLYLAATVANLTLVAAKAGLTGDIGERCWRRPCRQRRHRQCCRHFWRNPARSDLVAGVADASLSA